MGEVLQYAAGLGVVPPPVAEINQDEIDRLDEPFRRGAARAAEPFDPAAWVASARAAGLMVDCMAYADGAALMIGFMDAPPAEVSFHLCWQTLAKGSAATVDFMLATGDFRDLKAFPQAIPSSASAIMPHRPRPA